LLALGAFFDLTVHDDKTVPILVDPEVGHGPDHKPEEVGSDVFSGGGRDLQLDDLRSAVFAALNHGALWSQSQPLLIEDLFGTGGPAHTHLEWQLLVPLPNRFLRLIIASPTRWRSHEGRRARASGRGESPDGRGSCSASEAMVLPRTKRRTPLRLSKPVFIGALSTLGVAIVGDLVGTAVAGGSSPAPTPVVVQHSPSTSTPAAPTTTTTLGLASPTTIAASQPAAGTSAPGSAQISATNVVTTVPSVMGDDWHIAAITIEVMSLRPDAGATACPNPVVKAQSPVAGTQVAPGSYVSLTLSC
jgi:hypothetical protein